MPDPAPPAGAAPLRDRAALLAALRARVAGLERSGTTRAGEVVALCDGLPLPGGGLARAGMHEVLAADPGAAVGFCALVLGRAGGTVLWIAAGEAGPDAWPPGLARFGLSPARLILAGAARAVDALWAMEEALRCPAVAGALLALGRENGGAGHAPLDLTAARRLQLAAEAGGALGLLLRPDAAAPAPTAALTRWRVAALPGMEAAGVAHALGDPCWRLDLLRCRGGRPGGPWSVVWRSAAGLLELDPGDGAAGSEAVSSAILR